MATPTLSTGCGLQQMCCSLQRSATAQVRDKSVVYLPIQKLENMLPSISSVDISPVIVPI